VNRRTSGNDKSASVWNSGCEPVPNDVLSNRRFRGVIIFDSFEGALNECVTLLAPVENYFRIARQRTVLDSVEKVSSTFVDHTS
jgi:hypothetical protein